MRGLVLNGKRAAYKPPFLFVHLSEIRSPRSFHPGLKEITHCGWPAWNWSGYRSTSVLNGITEFDLDASIRANRTVIAAGDIRSLERETIGYGTCPMIVALRSSKA